MKINRLTIIGGLAFSALMFIIALVDLELQSGSTYQDLSIFGKTAAWLFCVPLALWVLGLIISKISKINK